MSDDRVRTLERRWRASGSLEDEVEWIRERARCGQLELGLLGLSAHLGHPAARVALADLAPEEADSTGWLPGWREAAFEVLRPGFAPDRIWFPGNPWPRGHRLAELEWLGRFSPAKRTLFFQLHLRSEDYDGEVGPNGDGDHEVADEDVGDWHSPGVWSNYHACVLSASYWGAGGFAVGTEDDPFDFRSVGQVAYRIDSPPPEEWDERAFGVYLLGHDGVGDHRIVLTPLSTGAHRLEWSGRLALEYVGSDEFCHRFFARKSEVVFQGFWLPEDDDSWRGCVVDPERWRVNEREGERWLVRR